MSNGNRNPLILSFTLLVVMLGYGMVLPVMPFYIEMLEAGGRELGWLMSIYSLMQLICAPVWGVISDRIGRKPVLAVGVLGYAVTLFMFGMATRFWMLFVARTLSGALSSATMPTAMAYIGDSAPEKERSGGMGQLGAAMGVGIVAGPLLGGILSARSLSLPFFIGSGFALVAFALVILILPESHRPRPASGEKTPLASSAVASIRSGRTLSFQGGPALEALLSPLGVFLLLIFITSFGMANFQGIIGLYVVDKLAFDTKQVGAIWMVMGGVLILAQGVLTGPLTKKFGELPLIRAGLAGGALGFVCMSLAVDTLSTLLGLSVFTLALALAGPALNAHLSRFAGEHQGRLMGLNSAATSLGRVAGPLWAGYIYDINFEYPFLSGAAAFLLGLWVSLGMLKSRLGLDTG